MPSVSRRLPPPPSAVTPEHRVRLQAIARRNAHFDGTFVYGVRTTGVYCVPSCPSRAALPQNIATFDTASAAAAAGYRPCRRCQPDRPRAPSTAAAVTREVCVYIAAHAEERLTLDRLAAVSGYSAAHLQRTFKAVVGVSPREYQAELRMGRLKQALRRGEPVIAAAHASGYGSASRLHAHADGRLGMTPSAYRAGGRGETIDYACGLTALGPLLIGATERGICFAQFGESEVALVATLAAEFPQALVRPSPAERSQALAAWLHAIDEHLAGEAPRPDLPLDIRGTAFQIRVWTCLMAVRDGEVLSYQELARRLGAPTAVRAAASACARNRIAVLIPCHRILRGDGSLGGYRWGLARKRALIDAERRRLTARGEARG